MNYTDLMNLVSQFGKGTIHTLTYARELKTKKNVTDIMTKIETVQVSFGVNYDNKKAVIEARNNGELPAENQGLAKNMEWVVYPYLLRNVKTGDYQLRCNGLKTNKHEINYYKNGGLVDAKDIINDCYSNEVSLELPDPRPTFNIALDKIVSII